MKEYIPKPIDTSDIELPAELLALADQMAKNVHEVWAKKRMEEDWIWGAERDDIKKCHPCLVAYEDLPEIEKEYDRATSEETIKFILKSGFILSKS